VCCYLMKGESTMQQVDLVVQNPTGLHARPAKVFVNTAKQFKSAIRIRHGKKKANGKSMISILTLGVKHGGKIRIQVKGSDEEEALQALEELVRSGLGEEVGADHGSTPEKGAVEPAEPVQPTPKREGNVLQGIPAAPGIAIGPVYQLTKSQIVIAETFIGVSEEQARLQQALEGARGQLAALRTQVLSQTAASEAAIFDVHLELLNDPEVIEMVLDKINQQQSAANAWQTTIDARAALMAGLDDPLLAARAADLHDVGGRVLRLLVGAEEQTGLALPAYPVIVVADDLSPSDTASLDKEKVLGFCTAAGGPTAHSAILARALGFAAVVSAGEQVLSLENQTQVILDGYSGTLTINPDAEKLAQAQERQRQDQARRQAAQKAAADPAITQDGHYVEVVANIGGVADAKEANASGAEGVGLLRTEFLFLERTEAPSEEEQFEVYRDIALALEGQPVIVRTLDIGGDKPLSYIQVPPEENPFLGERGIRLCLARPALLRQQLRAILRAANFGKLRIMFPMVADLSEWRAARTIVEEVRAELNAPPVELGIMIEVPSAALMADAFAREVDFFSIGTNDLTQYTLAMDRMHPTLATKSDGLHPAVLRLIQKTAQAAHQAGKWVGICGELGADPQAVPILVGLGVDELSVNVPAIPTVKAQIRSLSLARAQQLAQQALACATAGEVREKVKE
jgi:phosphocarrier protein FPr